MKSNQQYKILSTSFMVILTGIVFCSLFPLYIDAGKNEFTHLFQHETEFDSVNDSSGPEENDNPNSTFELVIKKTAGDKHSSPDTNGLALTRQALNYIEVVPERFYPDGSFLCNSPRFL